jgi:hypothetical protein
VPDGQHAPLARKDSDVRAAVAWLKGENPALVAARAPARQ